MEEKFIDKLRIKKFILSFMKIKKLKSEGMTPKK